MRKFMYTAAAIAIVMAGPVLAQGKADRDGPKSQQQRGPGKAKAPKADRGPDRKAKRQQQNRQADRRQSDQRQQNRREQRNQAARQQDRQQERRQTERQQDRRQSASQQDRREDNLQAASQRARQQQRLANRTDRVERRIRQDVRDARRIVTTRDRDLRSYRYRENERGRNIVRQRYVVNNDNRIRYRNWREADYGLIAGCPPGLAKKGNGCLPPGQARKIYQRQQDRYYRDVARANQRAERRAYYDYLAYNPRYRQADYRYSDGYAYRVNGNSNLVTAFLPLVGGALFQGNSWPQQYSAEPVPTYYSNYYGGNQDYSYRYADDTLFGVNPQNQSITGIAGLLTGNDFAVGQRVPVGYDVYNVPYDYRDRYYDRPDANYRYSDGYVYQVDPKTQLIQAAIQLLV